MHYYDVWVADSRFHADKALTYSSEHELPIGAVITIPLRNKMTTAFVASKTTKPAFATKPIKNVMSERPMPKHCLELARWMAGYYHAALGECLRQFAPSKPTLRNSQKITDSSLAALEIKLNLDSNLTADQQKAIKAIQASSNTTILLHGDTGTGKTRVYLELAKQTIQQGKSVIILTPEIALISQLKLAAADYLSAPIEIMHSQLGLAERKKTWLRILEADKPVVILGPRSALFAPAQNLGLIILDEAHEPAYKQEQNPRYETARVAAKLAALSGGKVILGSATPSLTDYYLAENASSIVSMNQPAIASEHIKVKPEIIDIKKRENFSRNPYISNQLLDAISETLKANQQVMIYLNRRGSARVILCTNCGWQALCPNCDVPLVYHGDAHTARCHTCGYSQKPPSACPTCKASDIVYKTIGTKALAETLQKLFPEHSLKRFDSDNETSETINDHYQAVRQGKVDILVGTQLLAKGLDLPNLGLVGVITAETSLSLPDFTAEERTFQLLYQVIGRVGRGHSQGRVVIQSYDPDSQVIQTAAARDYQSFYKIALAERQAFRFPPYAYLLKAVVRRASSKTAQANAENLKFKLLGLGLAVEIIGPAPSFFGRRGSNYYWQIVAKSKDRRHLLKLAEAISADWMVDLDPANLL